MSTGTYSQMHLQIVFAVKRRRKLIQKEWKEELYKYIVSIIKAQNVKPIIVNGVEDHIHILIGFRPILRVSDLVKEIKVSSSHFINSNKLCKQHFEWQDGYAVFSYSIDALPRLIRYIENQEEHHRKKSFEEEYLKFMKDNQVDFDERYLYG